MATFQVVIETRESQEGFRAYPTDGPDFLPHEHVFDETREGAFEKCAARLRHVYRRRHTFDITHLPV